MQIFFLTKLLWEMGPGVLPMTPKQSDRVLNGLVKYPLCQKKLKFQTSRIKTMLIIFFDSQGIVQKEFVREEKPVNTEFYKGVMDRFLKQIQRVRPAAFCSRVFSCFTIMRPTTKLQVFANFFYPKKCYNPLSPPYSPDLSPPDYFLFPKLKMKLKGLLFADVAEIQEAVTDELKKGPKNWNFQKLYNNAKASIQGLFKTRPNFSSSAPTSTESAMRLLSASSVRF
jgi:hypothetical protein